MAVTISHDEQFTVVKYAEDKRPIKIEPYVIWTAEDAYFLQQVMGFIQRESNAPHHLAKMEESKFFALIERLSTMICRTFSPKANWSVSKFEIRGIVLFTLQAAVSAGDWPASYKITDETFVQRGGDTHGE